MRTLILIILLSTATISYFVYNKTSYDDYEKLADKITVSTAKKLKEEKGLILIGTGGRMMEDIEMMSMGFEYHEDVDIDQARKLLIDSAAEYLSKINADEKIRPYLHNYPFTRENIKIEIYFRDTDNTKSSPEKVNIAATSDGRFSYYVRDESSLRTIKEESYEDAIQAIDPYKAKAD
jgi:hypothetical protein